ncbi:MAG: hypothetical protein ACTSQJ_02590 [Promethearchaeota archaeon]
MKVAHNLLNGRLFNRFRFLRLFFTKFLNLFANAEIYTLNECNKIIDILFHNYPHVYLGVLICCCRQAHGYYDKDMSNITDLTFVFSKTPGIKKRQRFATYISLEKAKQLLKKFDDQGFVHIAYGGCSRWIDSSAGLTICNCSRRRNGRGNGCIPMALSIEKEAFIYNKPHNIAIIDQEKCKGIEDCGKYIDFCNFNARILDPSNEKIKILREKCYCCALCLHHCPKYANSLVFLPKNRIYFYENIFKDLCRKYRGREEVSIQIKNV